MHLNYKKLGDSGPAVFILHGLFGMLDNWQTIGRWLSEDFQVYLVDQRNHGKSPHLPELTYGLMAEDLAELMKDLEVPQAIILGHSMGGKTAMRFALDFPEMTEALVVADMGIKTYPAGHDEIFKALFAVDVAAVQSRKEAETQLESLVPEFGVRQFLLKNLSRNKEGGYRWKMNLPVIHEHYDEILKGLEEVAADESTHAASYEGPTLFLRGSKSGYVSDEDWPAIQEIFPLAKLDQLEAGHWLHAERPQEFYERFKDFLNSL